jgi:hypothetical protein
MEEHAEPELVASEKRQTEEYLNRYLSDLAEGWPRLDPRPLSKFRLVRYLQTRRPRGYEY